MNGTPVSTNGASPQANADTRYWRSFGELENTPEFQDMVAREFPEGITDAPDEVSRRGFLGAVAASVALAGLTSCRKPVTKILPFNKRPEGVKPGIPQFYATALSRHGYGVGVIVKSSDGRPTKIEGNPDHPSSLGGADLRMQAELLQIYDPGRSHGPRNAHSAAHAHDAGDGHGHGGEHADHVVDVWAEFYEFWHGETGLTKDLVNKQGEGLHFLMPPTSSPATTALIERMTTSTFPKARFHFWAPLHADNELEGSQLSFGRAVATHYDLTNADVVVSLDSDFLETDGNNLRNARQWGAARRAPKPGAKLSRLYCVEATYTSTGTAADHRFRVRASDIPAVAFALANECGVGAGTELATAVAAHPADQFQKNGKAWVKTIADELKAAGGRCVVIAGPRQPASVHAVAHALNAQLGAVGKTVNYTARPAGLTKACTASLQELRTALEAGTVEALFVIGSNPVYSAPGDIGFAKLLEKAKNTIHVGGYDDETGRLCQWHFPQTHDLEAWGDLRSHDGTITVQQPLVQPLHGGVSTLEFLGFLNQEPNFEGLLTARDGVFGLDLVKAHWAQASGASDFESNWWPKALHDGLVAGSAFAVESVTVSPTGIAGAVKSYAKASGIELVLRGCPKMMDGRYANNSWMQEVPDPLTKLSWDNAALLSMATAAKLGVNNGDNLAITANGATLQVPAWVLPGHADDSITINLGWGRQLPAECKVADGAGFNAYPLRTTGQQWVVTGANVSKGTGNYPLVCTQEHGTMAGRAIVREAKKATNDATPRWAPMMSPLDKAAALKGKTEKDLNHSLWEERGYDKGKSGSDEEVRKSPYQWGMVIDLNACTGCSACVVACVAENNIPMVGKVQVARNREMFWIRADRYFTATSEDNLLTAEDPQVANMPVPCMQCENAPCESVCPVAATMHSPDGLNDMVYNRCIGTRYCSNNCPYKVRRYNYLEYVGNAPATKRMAFNPDVTVRSRGVMEKCTYCVQRINGGRIAAKLSGKKVGDGDNDVHVQPACAQTCPTQAITFGNIIDTTSKVAQLRSLDLNYGLLSELNTKPRTTYLGRVRNPNSAI
jgi:molybdopterin-containing oxidoreductase family iron-sulfur binding subunit